MKSAGSARGFVGEKKTMPPPTAPPSIVAQSNANTDFLKMLQGANNETNSRTTFTNTNCQAIPPGKSRGKRRISFGGGGSAAGGSGHGIGGGSGRSIDSGGSNSATGGANAGSNTPKLSQSNGIFLANMHGTMPPPSAATLQASNRRKSETSPTRSSTAKGLHKSSSDIVGKSLPVIMSSSNLHAVSGEEEEGDESPPPNQEWGAPQLPVRMAAIPWHMPMLLSSEHSTPGEIMSRPIAASSSPMRMVPSSCKPSRRNKYREGWPTTPTRSF